MKFTVELTDEEMEEFLQWRKSKKSCDGIGQKLIKDCGFDSRIKNILLGSGINTVNDLTSLTQFELRILPNVGRTTMEYINNFLNQNKLSFSKTRSVDKSV